MTRITKTLISKLKKQAKLDCKKCENTLTQVQDEFARSYGYPNWRTFISHEGGGAVLIDDSRTVVSY